MQHDSGRASGASAAAGQVQRMEAAADLTAAARAYQMAEQEASAADRIARDARSSALKVGPISCAAEGPHDADA